MQYEKILIAVNSKASSFTEAEYGFALAHQLKASVGLLYVVDKTKEITSADLGITPEESVANMLKRAQEMISQLTGTYHDVANVMHFTPEGNPRDEIVKTAREWKADMIIMGTDSSDGLHHLFTDGTAEHVIKHTHVPVMLIPKK